MSLYIELKYIKQIKKTFLNVIIVTLVLKLFSETFDKENLNDLSKILGHIQNNNNVFY